MAASSIKTCSLICNLPPAKDSWCVILALALWPDGLNAHRGGFPRRHLAVAHGQNWSQLVPHRQVAKITVDPHCLVSHRPVWWRLSDQGSVFLQDLRKEVGELLAWSQRGTGPCLSPGTGSGLEVTMQGESGSNALKENPGRKKRPDIAP